MTEPPSRPDLTSVYQYDIQEGAYLEVLEGIDSGRQIPLVKKAVTIGRAQSADVVLPDSEVSSRHAEIVREGGVFVLRDAGSRNGIEHRGQIIDELTLADGDVFSICRNRLKFVWPQGARVDGDILERREDTEVTVAPTRPSRSPGRRVGIALAAALAMVIAVGLALSRGPERGEVQVKRIKREPLRQLTSFSGRLVPRNEVRVFAAVSAPVVKRIAKEGQWVKKGDPILALDPEMLGLAHQKAKAELTAAHAAVKAAETSWRSAERKLREDRALARKGILSRAEVDGAVSAVNARRSERSKALAQLRLAETRLAQAKRNHADATVKAPIAGQVTTINIKVGESPHDLRGVPLATIEDASELLAEISAGEAKIGLLRPGQKAKIRVSGAGLGKEITGKVVQIAPKAQAPTTGAEATRYTAKVSLLQKDKRLRAGMQVQARITTASKDATLTVPLSAVVTGGRSDRGLGEQVAVYAPESGKVRWVGIETDLISTDKVEVLTGLKEGDLVIFAPVDLLLELKDGVEVSATIEK